MLALLFLVSIPKQDALAQTSVYGSIALVDYVFQNNGSSASKGNTGGLIGGMFYNFPIQSRLTAGVDVRGSYGFNSLGGALATAALRIGFVPHRVVLRPYFMLGGGVVTSTFSGRNITGPAEQGLTAEPKRFTSGAAEFAVGLDIRLNPSFDLRAVELGAAAGGTDQSVGSAFLDAGLVYHLPQRSHNH
ncbi:MAG: hypothetical protein M3Y50_14835 [Acidobacteriota bacterium]|nr:hypothetical protein [Acidobacteriota bacterium]